MVALGCRALGVCLLSLPFLVNGAPASTIDNVFEIVEHLNAVPEMWQKGAAPSPDTPLRLRLAIQHDKTNVFEQRVLDISTPGHQHYGQHMTRDEVQAFLQPPAHASNAIINWLREGGVSEKAVQVDSDWVHFTVPVKQAEKLLNTRFYYFQNALNKARVLRTLEYSVPKSISSYILMIQPTTKFGQIRPQFSTIFDEVEMASFKADDVDCNKTITPACLRDLYKMGNSRSTPDDRNKIGISGYLEQYARHGDFARFLELYAPEFKGTKFDVESIHGGENPQNSSLDSIEASLDVDYAIGLSGAKSVYYTTAGRGPLIPDLDQPHANMSSNEPYLDQLHYLLALPDNKLPSVLSTSYGENEQSVPQKYTDATCNLFARLGARGVSVIFSSGDTGVGSACQTNDGKNTTRFLPVFPAACPFVTSVGATTNIKPERAIYFSSGGFSDRYSRPWYQDTAVKDYLHKELGDRWKGLYNPAGRGFPDVAAQGYKFAVVDHDKIIGVSGTSASAPAFAAIVANLNSIRLAQGKRVLGFLNPFLYTIGRVGFTDIVHGGSTGCTGKDIYSGLPTPIVPFASWNATKGWDPVTGLGTPNFEVLKKLVTAF
ncbi:vesicle formation at the endoplasmic reticulum [Ophidiomyces ophidiicola]|uniref:Vesicle formation at the endoplasmic reticulum n=1 Tax=Ophidiomyces ophidiicola TaxID=1387563 RepID=A0ACB8UVX7_9EURO|nr:vesicle formation at the endoplasmic reticulum [Ophidiomyces ophidiicola]KAI1912263.1 vesicle formation at the endoplasmic reticulum [Ophidiomyces ophidiicola]KAI1920512.1 vesicle formation at the endoplasmic reticulum [Ophidiomyces ophidiicola]KAI1928075.1 vesicle formation at the endoplasmic reticulum [Ophidiomyces ophidiicola]KAI1946008.1 vesicle formation at the endoplasmic reticulum [Ophidiomyces ophidiicola]KAI1949811.1 vesicle formation at the endoplasmic reticulum [Ophidiomyces ophi